MNISIYLSIYTSIHIHYIHIFAKSIIWNKAKNRRIHKMENNIQKKYDTIFWKFHILPFFKLCLHTVTTSGRPPQDKLPDRPQSFFTACLSNYTPEIRTPYNANLSRLQRTSIKPSKLRPACFWFRAYKHTPDKRKAHTRHENAANDIYYIAGKIQNA